MHCMLHACLWTSVHATRKLISTLDGDVVLIALCMHVCAYIHDKSTCYEVKQEPGVPQPVQRMDTHSSVNSPPSSTSVPSMQARANLEQARYCNKKYCIQSCVHTTT